MLIYVHTILKKTKENLLRKQLNNNKNKHDIMETAARCLTLQNKRTGKSKIVTEWSKWFECLQLYVKYSAAVIPSPKMY